MNRLCVLAVVALILPEARTPAASLTPLGGLSTNTSANAQGVSADGRTVVGEGWSAGAEAFRWTAAGGMVGLGLTPGRRPRGH